MQTNDRPISELMKDVHTGKAQLPDFQRGWVWDDNRIRALIASITSNFPIGAAMFLEYGNENIRFKYRVIEGAPAKNAIGIVRYGFIPFLIKMAVTAAPKGKLPSTVRSGKSNI